MTPVTLPLLLNVVGCRVIAFFGKSVIPSPGFRLISASILPPETKIVTSSDAQQCICSKQDDLDKDDS